MPQKIEKNFTSLTRKEIMCPALPIYLARSVSNVAIHRPAAARNTIFADRKNLRNEIESYKKHPSMTCYCQTLETLLWEVLFLMS